MKTCFKLFYFAIILIISGCSTENPEEFNQPTNNSNQSENLRLVQRECEIDFYMSGNPTNVLKIKIEYAPIINFNPFTYTFTHDYQTRRTNFRNSFIAINPNISFEQLNDKKDLLITTRQIIETLEDDLCNAYLNYEITKVVKSTIVRICWGANVSEHLKQTTRNHYRLYEDLEFIKDIDSNCETWIYKGCCKTGVAGGEIEIDSETDLNWE